MTKKRVCALVAAMLFIITALPGTALANVGDAPGFPVYTDVPEDHWAREDILAAQHFGLMQGVSHGESTGIFGLSRTITRAEFVTVLTRMFAFSDSAPAVPTFSDVKQQNWYYGAVEAAYQHGVIDKTDAFSPEAPITREDMAVMLVRALGYENLAAEAAKSVDSLPFTDVTTNKGYITVAYDIGMTNGVTPTTFAPRATSKREEAAAMLVRVYRRMQPPAFWSLNEEDWLHGFYAFSSYAQRGTTDLMDSVSAGWASLRFDSARGAYVDTTYSDQNEWSIPASYESITGYLNGNETPLNLNIFMSGAQSVTLQNGSTASMQNTILCDEAQRTQAVEAVISEVTRVYDAIGKSPFSGVTIDFEGLRGAEVKSGFNVFLKALSERLHALDRTLYIAVQPDTWYDGFDYRSIGEYCDRVILMAHDYYPRELSGYEGTDYYKTAAVTPIKSVYHSLRSITDPETGVQDRSKLALAISFSSCGYQIEDGKLVDPSRVSPAPETLYTRMRQPDTVMGYSEEYENPYLIYRTEENKQYFVYYEDSRSVDAKIKLARMFGITGVSLWRIGTIPMYDGEGLYYNVFDYLSSSP